MATGVTDPVLILHAPMMVCGLVSKCQLRCKGYAELVYPEPSALFPTRDAKVEGLSFRYLHNLERRLPSAQRPEAVVDSQLHHLTYPSAWKDALPTALQQPDAQWPSVIQGRLVQTGQSRNHPA